MNAALDRARGLVDAARARYGADPAVAESISACAHRLDQPLRVALAGSLKAGKSTLLNALVGQDIAPTDATECTRVVTWYRNGPTPTVTAWYDGGSTFGVPVQRHDRRLTFDLGPLTADRVDHIDVQWPASALAHTTLVDTPGTSSLSRDVSARTLALLAPDDAASGADAVVYLMRTLGAADVDFLDRIGRHVGGESGPLGVIGVVSRADEVGAGRADAMASARDVASRLTGELERTGSCQAVVPVAGLLALAARTLRQAEFAAFEALAQVPGEQLHIAMLSADRFSRPDIELPVAPAMRAQLADRFGLFGIRMAVALVQLGIRDSSSLAAELVARSGLDELRQVIDVQFGQRADQLKAHSALLALDKVVRTFGDRDLRAAVQRELADGHGFAELRLLGRLRSARLSLGDDDLADLQRLIGGFGIEATQRLGLPGDASPARIREAGVAAVRRWRQYAEHPLLDPATARAGAVAARSAEGILTTKANEARSS
ncbi:Isoniazid-inducible protein iniC [Rhodococcus sp. HNM0563]|uniref:dynamin family protein n=1 Tax=unclassified Rhodococcus (in: high G+C Gram-positive bacteria) TaxID=192944 RepID=UPI00146ACD92|nr:dynamin family protein [Rhodococcus sp. F64268]MCK0090417.1 dynamin family protein [Rhodococcus sp. F64268]NLU61625.1 Isoniazid-inducible protein iniC [Rhodococcus sp. HNM0563]